MYRCMLPIGLLFASCSLHAQTPSPWQDPLPSIVNVEAMRDQFLRQAGLLTTTVPRVQCTTVDAKSSAAFHHCGFASMALPSYLRPQEFELPADCGILVTDVLPDSPAAAWGLRRGMTIVEIDGYAVPKTWTPTPFFAPQVLLVLTETGPVTLECLPAEDPLVNQPACAGPSSLSVSQVNGCYAVAAIFDRPAGPLHVELKGSRAEIEQQLVELPEDIQASLREHLR